MKLLIKNTEIVDPVEDYPGGLDLLIEDGVIRDIGRGITEEAEVVLDGSGLKLLPGLVDMHCHLREPGFEYKETVATGTKAAARGGFTALCCMPNINPVLDCEEVMNKLQRVIKRDAQVKVYPIAALSVGQQGRELTDMEGLKELGAIAFSDDGQPVTNNKLLLDALRIAKEKDFLIIDHCEDHSLVDGGVIHRGKTAKALGLKGISSLSEELPIMRDILLASEADCRIHIAHVSTKGAVEMLRIAKEKGIEVTCEVTPHHIGLSDEVITAGATDCKVNPPLRSAEDVAAMKQALKDGTIDVIATDHAPHHETEKGEDFYKAANGISGIETAFSVCYTELVEAGVMSLKELTAKMCYNPSKILGLPGGRVCVSAPADLVMVDVNKVVTVDKNKFLSKGKNTPFHGRSYKGEVIYTIMEGKLVYHKEEI